MHEHGSFVGTMFFWGKEYDCSKEDSIRFFKPSEIIFTGMNLNYSEQEGSLQNREGEIVCFDPSVYNSSPSCLLIRKYDFIKFLKENKLAIFWTVIGEKRIINTDIDDCLGILEISGSYYFDENCKLSGRVKTYYRK